MKQHASHVARTQKELTRLKQEIVNIEKDLSVTGSIKTADDVQLELDELSDKM